MKACLEQDRGVLGLLTEGMVSGTLCVLTKYEVVIRQRQLLVGELIALGPQLARG